ncbi:MAG: hypothetical protein RLN85_18425, partial [Pseudomonadales bacterium]
FRGLSSGSAPRNRNVTSLSFGRFKAQHGQHGFVLASVSLDEALTPRSDPAPFTHKVNAAKEIRLQTHAIETMHVERRVDPLEFYARRSSFQSFENVGCTLHTHHNIRWIQMFTLCSASG